MPVVLGILDDTVLRLNEDADGTNPGTRADYQAPVINIWDSDGEGNVVPSDPYGVVANGDVAGGLSREHRDGHEWQNRRSDDRHLYV